MNLFENVKGFRQKSSKFDLTHERKMSFNMGQLIPSMVQEIVPGDRFNVNAEQFIRMAPMIAPIMHRVNCYTHYFFVPNRIIWDNWEAFITGGRQGTTLPLVPQLRINDTHKFYFDKNRLPDYMGIPIVDSTQTVTNNISISALPFRAYAEIFNEYYQDQNLNDPIVFQKDDGVANSADHLQLTKIRNRCWEKDYFTSALPWAQRGGEASLPIDIEYKEKAEFKNSDGATPPTYSDYATGDASLSTIGSTITGLTTTGSTSGASIQNLESLGTTINDLRKSVRLQEWLEKSARAGSRYIEQILSHFGVRSSDQRLQRPEFLGGGKSNMTISEVLNQTGGSDTDTQFLPQGNMSGHGISVGANHGFSRKFEEHGYVIGIISVLPRTAYQQGLERHWTREDKFDYFWPEFANLGEQEIKNKELYIDPTSVVVDHEATFGYQSRYADYKYARSSVHGDFRDNLEFWHMGRKFANLPALNDDFVTADPTDRIFAVEDPLEHKLYCQILNKVSAIRPMPYFGTPRL